MAKSQFLTDSDAETIGWELAQRTADNQLDIWQRLLYQLSRAVSQADSPCHDRLWTINDTLYQLRRLPCPYLDLCVPMTPAEAYRLSQPGIQLGFDGLMRLQSLLHETSEQLGDHPAALPLLWVRDGIEERNAALMRRLTVTMEGESGWAKEE
ncbi:hypothetical protein [Nitrospira defluvii]|uniref:Uncharacterized protein n=1 Tax=Nitrospira defluvii TaxID=330214 RepID=A0ABN7LZW2_9BACT|nr:hypothetical protein [Nitrospira defluvii]CAE6777841.1 hypothetical protein NSPZN2_40606 [Nitrospira defluvii]